MRYSPLPALRVQIPSEFDGRITFRDLNEPDNVGWWDNMVGPGKPVDTNRFFVICEIGRAHV